MVFQFINIGTSLGTRVKGEEVRKQLVQLLNEDQNIIFDFSGVEIVSNSFADECFAKLIFSFPMEKIKKILLSKMPPLLLKP